MAYNADLRTAITMAPQLGKLGLTTTPTDTAATVIWERAFDRVRAALLSAGVGATFITSSVAEGWAQRAEMFLTSGEVLLAKGSIGAGAESTAPALIKMGEALLMTIPDVRQMLIDNGGSEVKGGVDSRAGSHWTRAKDPEWDPTPGGPDVPYASVPIFDDASDL